MVCATNRDLEREVGEGRFREDLLYRLNVVTFRVPPLREHKEDIALLARYLLRTLKTEHSSVEGLSEEVLSLLEAYDWPGNIRELENVIRRALALCRKTCLGAEDLPAALRGSAGAGANAQPPRAASRDAYEVQAIRNALRLSVGNRRQAAQILKIGEATLYRKLKKYGLEHDPGG